MYERQDVANLLLAAGANVTNPTRSGQTALHLATKLGEKPLVDLLLAKKEVITVLLRHGANVNAMDYNCCAPLDMARQNDHKEIIQVLRTAGGSLGHEIIGQTRESAR